jgi:hypothetical protein
MTTYTVGPSGSGADYIVSGSNDQVEINSALQAAADTPGSTVYLLENTYDIYATNLRIGSNTTLTGDSGAILKLNNSCSWASMVPVIGQIGGTGTATSNVEIHGSRLIVMRLTSMILPQGAYGGKDTTMRFIFAGLPLHSPAISMFMT